MNEEAPQTAEPTPTQSTVEENEKIKLRILVADDDEAVSQLVKDVLESEGHTIEVVKNGQLLINELLEKGPGYYALVISDNDMPEKTGIEALEEIHSMPKFKNLPRILLTGDTLNKVLSDKIQKLDVFYLGKPFSIDSLCDAVKNMTANKELGVSPTE